MRSMMSNKAADELAAIVLGSKEAADAMKARLNAHNGASKRSKSKTRRVNTPATENRLKSALCANLGKACDALCKAAFEVRPHPYLEGVLCREDGAVFVPGGKAGLRGHWTFGSQNREGYRCAHIQGRQRYVHRLICEAFHGACPADKCQIDHIDRDPANNNPENLRWVNRSENIRNRDHYGVIFAKYGVTKANDRRAYEKLRRAEKKGAGHENS